jgi:DNA-binding NarL/FixJ family response regulator
VNQPKPRRPTILLVDDSELACEAVKHTLEPDFQVVTLNGPFGFIKAIRESRPGLILVDVGLGSMNGTKLVSLARDHAPANCRILLYSSRDARQLEGDVQTSGADGFISKTTTGKDLIASVRQWIRS